MRMVNPMDTELRKARQINRPAVGGIVMAMICLVGAMGCSRLGSNSNLSQRRIPFPQQPLRQANPQPSVSETAAAHQSALPERSGSQHRGEEFQSVAKEANGSRQNVDEFGFNPSPGEIAAVNDSVRNVKARLPKLADLSESSSFQPSSFNPEKAAQPVIDNVAQVAFERSEKDFDPSAAPPAGIFSQPLREAEAGAETVSAALNQEAAKVQSSLATILPVAESNQAAGIASKNIDRVSQTLESSRQRLDPLAVPQNLRPDSSRRILLLSDDSSLAAPDSIIQQVSAVQPAGLAAVEASSGGIATTRSIASPLLPVTPVVPVAPVVPEVPSEKSNENTNEKTSATFSANLATQAPYVSPPVASAVPSPKVNAISNGPKVDASLTGEVYPQAALKKLALKKAETLEDAAALENSGSLEKASAMEKAAVTLVDAIQNLKIDASLGMKEVSPAAPKRQQRPVAASEVGSEISKSNPMAGTVEQSNGIEIDPTLGQQRDRLANFSPRPAEQTEPTPARVVYQNQKAPFLMLPRIRKPVVDVAETRIASVKQDNFAAAWDRKDFHPISQCTTCDDENCHGCNVPPENHFASSAPAIDGGRSLAPMAVEPGTQDTSMVRKNFGQVAFSSAALPLPQTVVGDTRNIAESFEQQFVEEEAFVQTPTQSDVPPVGVDAVLKLNAVTWRSRLRQTIELVQEQLDSDVDSQTRTSMEINLRLLDVLSRQMGDVAQEHRQFTVSENQYWQHQLEAITSMLQTTELADVHDNNLLQHHTAHQTLTHLRHAIAQLESLANLKISSGVFCTEVSGYGQFESFPNHQFAAGQKVLVYCEVENYSTIEQPNETGSTFHTKLRGSYAIYDAAGHAVQQAEFPVMEDVARKRRRDFYMHLPITIGDLSTGSYELHLLVEDLGGNKTASLTPPLSFVVGAEQPSDRQARSAQSGNWIR